VEHHANGLTKLAFDGGTLLVPRIERPPGTALRVRLRADDILLAREAPPSISANNVLAAEVISVRAGGSADADIALLCGNVKLVSRITRASLVRLGLAAGEPVFAIVKSVTVDPQLGLARGHAD
jgi:molybdate transport system ATP-binding protein